MASILLITACSHAEAGHSQNNGTCDDDKLHYENMTVNGKRSDAPLYDKSQTLYSLALSWGGWPSRVWLLLLFFFLAGVLSQSCSWSV